MIEIIQVFLSFFFYLILGFTLGISVYMVLDHVLIKYFDVTIRKCLFKEKPMTHLLNKHKNITDLYNALIKIKLFYKDKKEFDKQLCILCDESVMSELKRIKE